MRTLTGNNRFLIKLSKANSTLSKLRHFINRKTLKSIYHAIFEPHLYYSSLVWAQNSNSIKKLFVLQKKSLRIIYFLNHNAHILNYAHNTKICERNSVNISTAYTWNYLQN